METRNPSFNELVEVHKYMPIIVDASALWPSQILKGRREDILMDRD